MTEFTLTDIVGGGGGLAIKSLQRGLTSFSGTNRTRNVTVTAVVMAMSVVHHSWRTYLTSWQNASRVELTTTTNLYFGRGANVSDAISELSWELIEYE